MVYNWRFKSRNKLFCWSTFPMIYIRLIKSYIIGELKLYYQIENYYGQFEEEITYCKVDQYIIFTLTMSDQLTIKKCANSSRHQTKVSHHILYITGYHATYIVHHWLSYHIHCTSLVSYHIHCTSLVIIPHTLYVTGYHTTYIVHQWLAYHI